MARLPIALHILRREKEKKKGEREIETTLQSSLQTATACLIVTMTSGNRTLVNDVANSSAAGKQNREATKRETNLLDDLILAKSWSQQVSTSVRVCMHILRISPPPTT